MKHIDAAAVTMAMVTVLKFGNKGARHVTDRAATQVWTRTVRHDRRRMSVRIGMIAG